MHLRTSSVLLSVFLFAFVLVGGPSTARADSQVLWHGCQPSQPCPTASNIYANGQLNKASYAPGESITFTVEFSSDDAPQAQYVSARGNVNLSGLSANLFPNPVSSYGTLQIGISNSAVIGQAPTTPGSYSVITAYSANGYGAKNGSIPFTVTAPPTVSCTANGASSATIPANGSVSFAWIPSAGATSCRQSWDGAPLSISGGSESLSFPAGGPYSRGVVCDNAGGSGSCSTTITIGVCPAPLTQNVTVACDPNSSGVAASSGSVTRSQTKSPYPACSFPALPVTTSNSTYVSDNCVYPSVPTVSCTANGVSNATIVAGGSVTFAWTPSANATSCRQSWDGAPLSVSGGSKSLSFPAGTFSRGVVCANAAGDGPACSTSITAIAPISVTLTASPAGPLTAPGSTTLSWTTTGTPDSCVASNYWSGTKTASGGSELRSGIPVSTQIFDITCSKAGTANATASVSVTVTAAPTVNIFFN